MRSAITNEDSAPAKRRKTPLACKECRERKRKCDAVRPICGACVKRSRVTPCVFDTDRLKRYGNKRYDFTASLE